MLVLEGDQPRQRFVRDGDPSRPHLPDDGITGLPGPSLPLEFVEVTGLDRFPLDARVQDPGAARIQLTVSNLETTLQTLRAAGPSTVASTGGRIITQPRYRVVVASDLSGLYLVLTDQRKTP